MLVDDPAQRAALPAVVEECVAAVDGPARFLEMYRRREDQIEEQLLVQGAILFRGFSIDQDGSFERLMRSLPGRLLDYVDGNSPRKMLAQGVYTSTEYPSQYFISLHNELSYAAAWPTRLYFCCVVEPQDGGETPLADSRRILARLDQGLVETFVTKKVKYIRNLHGGRGFGPSWQTTFATGDRQAVERLCRDTGSELEWNGDGSLTLSSVRPAIAAHPKTGELVWFNQADQFHPSTHPKQIYDAMMLLYEGRENRLPQYVRFGDDSPIPREMLDAVRAAVKAETHTFRWRKGDLLMLDNMLISHGRAPFKGPRKILVSMTDY